MNIPAASGPSIFQPSNILCSSTPTRQSTRHVANRNSSADLHLDPSETPIRGPGAKRKTATSASTSKSTSSPLTGRRTGWTSNSESRTADVASSSNSQRGSHAMSGPSTGSTKHGNKASNITRHFAPNVGSNSNTGHKQNVSSNSESDQTDTDSCNVTGPQRLGSGNNLVKPSNNRGKTVDNKPVSASQNIPVFKSSDTDNDFPTTDFNNVDEMNDLNRTGGKGGVAASTPVFPPRAPSQQESVIKTRIETDDHYQGLTAQSRPMSVSASVPVLRKKIYTEGQGNGSGAGNEHVNTESKTNDMSKPLVSVTKTDSMDKHSMDKHSNAHSANSLAYRGTPSNSNNMKSKETEKPVARPMLRLPSGSEDFEDDLLFDTPSMERKNITPRPSESSTTQPRVRQDSLLQPEIPAVLPAKSTELASFSQSPRYLNKNYNNIQAPQYAQHGYRPNPVKTVPKSSGRNVSEQTYGQGPYNQGTGRNNEETNLKSHLISKQKPQEFPNRNRDSQILEEKGKGSFGPTSKEPLSANWFTTPADLDTHLAKSVSDGGLHMEDLESDETSLKKSDIFTARNSTRSRSAHSDSGIAPSDSSAVSDGKHNSHLSKTDKDKVNYQHSEYSRQGYFSDSVMRDNAFSSSRSRVVHSPVNVRQTQNMSPVIKDYVSHSPLNTDSSHSSTLLSEDRQHSSSLASDRSAQGSLKTEKGQTGACFSPIHPQPVTSNKQAKASVVLNKDIVHPTPVGKPGQGEQRNAEFVRQNSSGNSIDLK